MYDIRILEIWICLSTLLKAVSLPNRLEFRTWDLEFEALLSCGSGFQPRIQADQQTRAIGFKVNLELATCNL